MKAFKYWSPGNSGPGYELPFAVCLGPNERVPSGSCGHADGTYVVVNIRWDDVDKGLVIRSSASMSGIQQDVIPPNGTDILRIGACEADWCPVQCGRAKGWARAKYLSARSQALYSVTHISSHDSHGLIVRNGPHKSCSSTGSIPFNGRDVILHSCVPSPIDKSTWCRVTYNKSSGWVAGGFLEQQN